MAAIAHPTRFVRRRCAVNDVVIHVDRVGKVIIVVNGLLPAQHRCNTGVRVTCGRTAAKSNWMSTVSKVVALRDRDSGSALPIARIFAISL